MRSTWSSSSQLNLCLVQEAHVTMSGDVHDDICVLNKLINIL
jgi:hypothetical protein